MSDQNIQLILIKELNALIYPVKAALALLSVPS